MKMSVTPILSTLYEKALPGKNPDNGGKGVLYGKSPDNIRFLKIDGKNPDNSLGKGIIRKKSDELIVRLL
jgi:hypothetical protein